MSVWNVTRLATQPSFLWWHIWLSCYHRWHSLWLDATVADANAAVWPCFHIFLCVLLRAPSLFPLPSFKKVKLQSNLSCYSPSPSVCLFLSVSVPPPPSLSLTLYFLQSCQCRGKAMCWVFGGAGESPLDCRLHEKSLAVFLVSNFLLNCFFFFP